jgi:hypothetical protein
MATAPPTTLHDAEFTQLAMALVVKNQQLTSRNQYEFKGVTFTSERKHIMSGGAASNGGLPELINWGERYPVVRLGGTQLFSKETWLVTGPWCKQLPELAAQHLDALQVALDNRYTDQLVKASQLQREQEENARRQHDAALVLWNKSFGGDQ